MARYSVVIKTVLITGNRPTHKDTLKKANSFVSYLWTFQMKVELEILTPFLPISNYFALMPFKGDTPHKGHIPSHPPCAMSVCNALPTLVNLEIV